MLYRLVVAYRMLVLLLGVALITGGDSAVSSHTYATTYPAGVASHLPPYTVPALTLPYNAGPGSWLPLPEDDVGPLYAIASVAPNDVWAVGETVSRPTKALIAHWNGERWSVTAKVATGPTGHTLNAIAAISRDDVWAVGWYETSNPSKGTHSLTVHWDGKSWQIVPSPNLGDHDNRLNSISAVSSNSVWAAGGTILHWDGSAWSYFDSPPGSNGYFPLFTAIQVKSDSSVWVASQGGIWHWNGDTWQQKYALDMPYHSAYLQILEVLNDSDIWGAGYSIYSGANTHSTVYIVHWNGESWSSYEDTWGKSERRDAWASYCTDPSLSCTLLSSIAISPDNIWFVGGEYSWGQVLHWNGQEITQDPCPPQFGHYSDYGDMGLQSRFGLASGPGALTGITEAAPGQMLAVGNALSFGSDRREYYGYVINLSHGPCPTATPTATHRPTATLDTRPRPTLPPPQPSVMAPYVSTHEAPIPLVVQTYVVPSP